MGIHRTVADPPSTRSVQYSDLSVDAVGAQAEVGVCFCVFACIVCTSVQCSNHTWTSSDPELTAGPVPSQYPQMLLFPSVCFPGRTPSCRGLVLGSEVKGGSAWRERRPGASALVELTAEPEGPVTDRPRGARRTCDSPRGAFSDPLGGICLHSQWTLQCVLSLQRGEEAGNYWEHT